MLVLLVSFFFSLYGDHRDLHGLTHSFPTRRSSDRCATLEREHRHDGEQQCHQSDWSGTSYEYPLVPLRALASAQPAPGQEAGGKREDRKSTRLNSSH